MENFNFFAPTNILFGKGQLAQLPGQISKYGSRVLLAYGGGSIKKTGLYDAVTSFFKKNNIEYYELSGIEPNPKITSVRDGVKICREHNIQAIVPVGGGSTIDCCKAVSAAVYYEGDPWELVLDWSKVGRVLPIFTVLTMAATGTEMNGNAVISNMEDHEKKALIHPSLKPVCSILDPTYTFTVSKYQTASGIADIMSHIFEAYFSRTAGAAVQDYIAEALLKTCIRYGKKAVDCPEDYEARANLMWTSSLAINGLIGCGKYSQWSCHPMEHQLSAYYDITHGAGLAVLTPAWFEYVLNYETVDKFISYGVNVWEIDAGADKFEIARQAIQKTREYFNRLGLPKTLSDFDINAEYFDIMAEKAVDNGLANAYVPLDKEAVIHIYKACL